jgi:acyl-ACP thioesterase
VATADERAVLTARAIWVLVDVASGAPRALPEGFRAAYGAAATRRVPARLVLPDPPAEVATLPWQWRRTDFDLYRHVTNASYWLPVEEHLADRLGDRRITAAEIEFGAGIGHGETCVVAFDDVGAVATFWFLVAGRTRAAARVRFAGRATDHR